MRDFILVENVCLYVSYRSLIKKKLGLSLPYLSHSWNKLVLKITYVERHLEQVYIEYSIQS